MDFYEHYYRPTRILLTALGLWPYNDSVFKYIQNIFFSLLFGFSICLQIGKIVISVTDLDSLFGILWFTVPCLIFSLKYATFCIKSKDIKTLIESLKHNWSTIKRKEEIEILKQYTNVGYIMTISMITLYYLGILGFLTTQILPKILDIVAPLNESRPAELLGLATYFFDQEKYFFPILMHMTAALSAEAATILATETMCLIQMQHICGLFKIASFRIQRVFNCELHVSVSQRNMVYHANLVDAVIIHNKAMEFFSLLNSCFETSYFILFWLSVCSLTINMFRLFQAGLKKETQQSLASGILVLCHFIYIFMYHIIPQLVTNHSNDIFYKVCNLPWYSVPIQLQKMLQLVIQRTTKPCKFTLYMFDISLELFASLLNFSLSYFTIFWSMQYSE
ncbi:hypothetical protein HN011_009611 [Eciton burchellii]|nr:hypothetical protein HN011_009611 [Eciton burchellii]